MATKNLEIFRNIVERLSIERPAPLLGAAIRNTVVVVTALKISITN